MWTAFTEGVVTIIAEMSLSFEAWLLNGSNSARLCPPDVCLSEAAQERLSASTL